MAKSVSVSPMMVMRVAQMIPLLHKAGSCEKEGD